MPRMVFSQKPIWGKVLNKKNTPISGAIISILNTSIQTKTDSSGNFTINSNDSSSVAICVAHEFYLTDTILTQSERQLSIVLVELQELKSATIKGESNNRSSYIGIQTIKTEIITQGELKKAACCDLAGCFETQGTVQPMTTNILTNSKELRILGLSGVYNQVLIDGMPMIQGLSYTYGISGFPGTLVDNIFVAKGTTSVLQGYESMVGQVNVVPKSPKKGDKLFLNSYVNSFGERHFNTNWVSGKGKFNNLISTHMVQPALKWDRDQDGFLDLPKLTRYMFYDKIKFGDESKKGINSTIGIRFIWEQRIGGQINFDPKFDLGSSLVYGQKVSYYQPELYSKTTYRIRSNKKITFIASGLTQKQATWLGLIHYLALQKNAYTNMQYELKWHDNHELKTGISYRFFSLNENIAFSSNVLNRTYDKSYLKNEKIPGFFAENTFSWKGDIITLISGIRADHHNIFGWQITPRMMLKYDVAEKTTIRASAGTGWRTVNLFSENIGLLVSSRNIIFKETLNPEKAFNWGVNILQKFNSHKTKKIDAYVTCDFYRTIFKNQFFPDYDTDPTKAFIANYTGPSVSNGFQSDLSIKWHKIFETKIIYNYLDVYRLSNSSKIQLPFNSKHKLLFTMSYTSKNKLWRFDVNAHWFGKQRLPNTAENPTEYRQAEYSKTFTTINIQLTKTWKKIELYSGCENLLDFRQLKPIVSWQNPFSPYFDTSFNWGPTRGREVYIGIRYKPFN